MEKKLKQIKNPKQNCIKVVLYGPESTGKSSLAIELAKYYNTVYVEEFSRSYAETKTRQGEPLSKADVLPIAMGQMQLENAQLSKANSVLICDTELLETKVYSEFYYNGYCPVSVKKYALENTYNLYFLTYIDTVWVADGIRDLPNHRMELYHKFKQALIDFNKPYVVVKGHFEERLNTCIKHIDELLKEAH